MIETNILCVRVNGVVVYEKTKETNCIQKEENFIIEEHSVNSSKSTSVVLPLKKV